MAKFSIAFDHADLKLGHYFQSSKDDISVFITQHDNAHLVHEIPSADCTQAYIDGYMATLKGERSLFIAYSHGNNEFLSSVNGKYILSPENTGHFTNCFLYSMACNTGKILGPDVVAKGCITFIGYNDTAYALLGEEKQLSIDCDNKAIKEFMSGSSAQDAVIAMKAFLKESIRELIRNKKALKAGYLRHNLAVLVIYGDTGVLFNSFN